jgi:hypothetical protein
MGWCYWGYLIAPISPYHGVGLLLAHIPKQMGVKPDRRLVEKLAAQVVAYRQGSRDSKGTSILQGKGVSEAVRSIVGKYESKHKGKAPYEKCRLESNGVATGLRKTTTKRLTRRRNKLRAMHRGTARWSRRRYDERDEEISSASCNGAPCGGPARRYERREEKMSAKGHESSSPCNGAPQGRKVVPRGGTREGITQVEVEGRGTSRAAEDDNEDYYDNVPRNEYKKNTKERN